MSLALALSLIALVCYAALLALVFRRGLRSRVNQLFGLFLAAMLLWQAAYIIVCLSHSEAAALLGYRISTASVTAEFILFCFFVRALLGSRERLGLILTGALIWVGSTVAALTDQGHFLIGIRQDLDTGLFVPEYGPFISITAISTISFLCVGIVSLVRGLRQATSNPERNRLRYLLLAILIILLGALANMPRALIGYPIDVVANIIAASLLSYAILRYQLLDITVVVRRGLAYTMLTVAIALAYLLSILLFEFLARGALNTRAFVIIPLLLAVLATAVLRPLRERALAWVDRFIFRQRYNSALMLRELSRRTAAVIDLEKLGNILLSEICRAMRLRHAALFLRREGTGDFYVAAQQGLGGSSCPRLGQDHPVVQWLRLSEQPLHSRELDLLPQFRSLWHEEKEALRQLDAELFVPLLSKDGLVGILAVSGRLGGGGLSDEDEVTLVTLANQTAVAVENARLFATTRARVAELTALQETGVRLVSSRTLPSVLRVVAESAIGLLSADEAYVAIYQADRGYWLSHGVGVDGQERTLVWDSPEGLAIRAAQRGTKPMIVEDLRLTPILQPQEARESRVRSCAIHPLRRGDAAIGVLAALYYQPKAFSDEEMRLLSMLSDHASLAIENARLLEAERARRQLADTLREMSRVIGSTLDLDRVLELVLEQLKNVVHYDSAAIMLLSGDQLEVSNARGFVPRTRIIGTSFPVSRYPFFENLLARREPLVIDDVTSHNPGFKLEGFRARSAIAVPLVVRDQPRGILIMSTAEANCYTADDLQNALAFANQAAIAIENARLYREAIQEKHKAETILRETFSGIVVTDVDLRVVSFNAGAEAITGYKAADVLGKYLPDVLGPYIASPESPLGQAVASGQRVGPQETVVPAANGMRDVLQGAVPLRGGDGAPFGYLLSLADITRLKEVDRLKSDIVANVSHELRTPLASIKAYAELLLHNVEGDDRELRDQFLEVIDLEADRLSQLISDLLNLSRLEAGRFEVRKAPIDLGAMLNDVLGTLDVQRRNQGVTIRIDAPADLPKLNADREMVAMIVKNLTGNAIKFSRRGGEVTIALRDEGEWLAMQVIDHGMGIPSDAIPHLFQKFYRAPMAAEAGIEGTGLGLVLVKQAVEAHGGTIGVESQLGVGTTFTVRLPWG